MKDTTYILIPGLNDQQPLFMWFYKTTARRWTRRGMPTRIMWPKWGSTEPYEPKLAQLSTMISEERSLGNRVALVGVSAGATLGLLAFCRGGGVTNCISVAGFTQISPQDRANKNYMKLSWYKAADAAQNAVTALPLGERERVMSLYGQHDSVIEPRRQQIAGAKNIQMRSFGHLLSIIMALTAYRRRIKRFAASKGSE